MRILSVDISQRSSGYALIYDGKVEKTGLIKNPLGQNIAEYLVRIRDHVEYLITTGEVDHVVIEDLFIQYNAVGKSIYQIHGVIKEVSFRHLKMELFAYPQQTWRYKMLGLKNNTKEEKLSFEQQAKAEKGAKYKTYFKHLCDIKHKVIEYVNNRCDLSLTFVENDIADAIGVGLAHHDKEKKNEVNATENV